MILSYIQAAKNEGMSIRLRAHSSPCLAIARNAPCTPVRQTMARWLTYKNAPGIWTKHLKAKTELHQTVIDRCLKSLVQKQLIKTVKSKNVRILKHTLPWKPS